MERIGEELPFWTLLDQTACVHDENLVCHIRDDAQVMGDEDDRRAVDAAKAIQEVDDLGLDRDVERGGGLVGDQDARVAGECHGDHHPLAHSARELVGVVVEACLRVGDPDLAEQIDAAPPYLGLREVGVEFQRLRDLRPDAPAPG